MRKQRGWTRLDNAATWFPPTSRKQDPKVFRFSCELKEDVVEEDLQKSLEKTLELYPGFLSVIRHGFFWYYLETVDIIPLVHEEDKQVCNPLYDRNEHNLLFDVSYYRRRINLEIFHSLADGTGALEFLKDLVCNYLWLRHPEDFQDLSVTHSMDASITERMADSFQKYYDPKNKGNEKLSKAYNIKGPRMPESRIRVIEGIMPVDKVHALAKSHNTSITALLASILICAIAEKMHVRERYRTIRIVIPVNLRNYFESDSVRNFFAVTHISYTPGKEKPQLNEVINSVARQFKENITKEKISARMNSMISIEKNLLVRAIPLALKDLILRLVSEFSDLNVSSSLSNVGRVQLPDKYSKYINLFDVMTSTNKLQICMCSYGNNMAVTFTDSFISADIQKFFFRTLSENGIDLEVTTTPFEKEGEK